MESERSRQCSSSSWVVAYNVDRLESVILPVMLASLAIFASLLRCYTNPNKLLNEFPHPGLLPLEKVSIRTYWDWYYIDLSNGWGNEILQLSVK